MATFNDNGNAAEYIYDMPRLNNAAVGNISALEAMYQKRLALSVPARDVIRQAEADMGYSSSEIEAILTNWHNVYVSGAAAGIASLKLPR